MALYVQKAKGVQKIVKKSELKGLELEEMKCWCNMKKNLVLSLKQKIIWGNFLNFETKYEMAR